MVQLIRHVPLVCETNVSLSKTLNPYMRRAISDIYL